MGGDEGVVWYLRTSEEILGSVRMVVVEGRVARATATALDQAVAGSQPTDITAVIVDLTGVDYVNGAGLRVFEAAAARLAEANAALVVCGLQPAVQTAFDLAGSIPNLTTAPTPDAALRRFQAGDQRPRSTHG